MDPLKFDPTRASQTTSGENLPNSGERKALILRCQLALFSSYRADQYADPEGFKNSLGAVLEGFPDEVIRYVCDPRTGIQRRLKWPPAISEIVEACEEHQEFLFRARTAKPAVFIRLPEPERPAGYLANIFVPENNRRYPLFVAWAKKADPKMWKYGLSSDDRHGIWVNISAWETSDNVLAKIGES